MLVCFAGQMSSALERIARNSKKNKNKEVQTSKIIVRGAPRHTGSGGSGSGPAAEQNSPGQATSRFGHKRNRAGQEILDITNESEKDTYTLPPCFLSKDLFANSSLKIQPAESVMLDGMTRPVKRASLSHDASAVMRVLEMAVAYTEGGTSQERELRVLKESHSSLEAKYKQLSEQSEAREKRMKEMAQELEASKNMLVDRDALIDRLKAEAAPAEDESPELKKLITRAELVARIYQADDDAVAAVEESFNNAIAQLKLVNPGIELSTEGTNFSYLVRDGQIKDPSAEDDTEEGARAIPEDHVLNVSQE